MRYPNWHDRPAVAIFCGLIVAGCFRPSTAQTVSRPLQVDEAAAATYDFTEFRKLLTEPVDEGRIPCASAILVHRNRVIFKEAVGLADIEKNIPFAVDTICHVGSTTKWISGATLMAMVDEGKISLDEPAGKYLPRYRDMPIRGSNLKGNPTIRHCFSGLSGLLGHPNLLRISNTIPLMESVDWIADNVPELGHAPGTGFGHISVGMQVAGGAVETAAGRAFQDYMKEKVLGPLGMTDTTFNPQPAVLKRLSKAYVPADGGFRLIRDLPNGNVQGVNIGGGLYSTLDDCARFLLMNLNDGRLGDKQILSPASVRELQRDQTGGVPKTRRGAYHDQLGYAFGAAIFEVDEDGNPVLLGDGGGYGTFMWIDRKANLVGAYFTQSRARPNYDLLTRHVPSTARETVQTAEVAQSSEKEHRAVSASAAQPKPLTVPAGDTQRLSPEGHVYLDPEVLSERSLVTFIDAERWGAPRRVWVGELDPMTGLWKRGDGRDILIDTGHSRLRFTNTGSEWALDRHGWSVVYTKEVDGTPHMWRGYVDGEEVVAKPITSGEIPTFGGVGSINPDADSIRIIAISGAWDGGEKVWVDVKDGTRRHWIQPSIPQTDGRWIAGTNQLVAVIEEKEHSGQLLLMDTDTGESKRITNDHGRKGRFYGWLAPEAGGKVRVLAVRDKRELVVYEDRGGQFWEAIQTHQPPNNGVGMSSPEPFVAAGRSYASVSVGLRMEPGTRRRETQIWILDLSGEKSPPIRGDMGRSDPGHCSDAEIFVGAEQVFVVYTYHPPGGQVEVRRTATGIRSQPRAEKPSAEWKSPAVGPLAEGAGTAAGTDASEAAGSTDAMVPGAAPTAESFKRAADYSARNGGRAVLVMVDGNIVFERYDNGFGPDTATHLHSATKGFWGPVIAAMIEDGFIASFDEPAGKTLPEWAGHPRKSRITLRHLLNLSAGLVQDVQNLQGHDRPTLAPDLYRHAIGVPALREPGSFFQYGPSCYYALGEIMKRKLVGRQRTPLDYLKQRILDPIGVEIGDWVHDASGNPHIPNGAHLTARNWIKYGQWLLQGGEWNGEQIVAKDLLKELAKPSEANPGHGLALWLNQPGGRGGHRIHVAPAGSESGFIYHRGCPDLFAALGAGKCRMYVIPSLKMVAVRQADSQGDRYWDSTFLSLLLGTGQTAAHAPGGTQ